MSMYIHWYEFMYIYCVYYNFVIIIITLCMYLYKYVNYLLFVLIFK